MDFTPRKKKKHGNTVKMARTKKIVREEHKRVNIFIYCLINSCILNYPFISYVRVLFK